MTLLLDTCSFLWLAAAPAKLSAGAADGINDSENTLALSLVSVMEIVLKHSAGKLVLPEAPRVWISKQMDFFQIAALPLSQEAVYLGGELPRVRADPFDRLIAAEAILRNLSVITPDAAIRELGAKCIW